MMRGLRVGAWSNGEVDPLAGLTAIDYAKLPLANCRYNITGAKVSNNCTFEWEFSADWSHPYDKTEGTYFMALFTTNNATVSSSVGYAIRLGKSNTANVPSIIFSKNSTLTTPVCSRELSKADFIKVRAEASTEAVDIYLNDEFVVQRSNSTAAASVKNIFIRASSTQNISDFNFRVRKVSIVDSVSGAHVIEPYRDDHGEVFFVDNKKDIYAKIGDGIVEAGPDKTT